MLVDSHTHLYLDEFDADRQETVQRAFDAGVGHLMFPNVDMSTIEPMNRLASIYPDKIDMAIGLHPTEVDANWRDKMARIKQDAATGRYKAVGEIGIDLYWDKTYRNEQLDAFDWQCRLAVELNIPVIIHCRDGLKEILDVMDGLERRPRGVFHSFGGSADDIAAIRQRGDFYFGINGIVTFKNSALREVLPMIGIDRILLETDSPYLAPVPMRGRRNESAYLVHVAGYVAHHLDVPVETLADVTTRNYFDMLLGSEN